MPTTTLDSLARSVGRRVAEVRAGRGITQEKLAEQMEVTVRYLQRIEAGEEKLTLRSLVTLANLLGVRPIDFFRTTKRRPVRVSRS